MKRHIITADEILPAQQQAEITLASASNTDGSFKQFIWYPYTNTYAVFDNTRSNGAHTMDRSVAIEQYNAL